MPFTLAHPAAIIPIFRLSKRNFVLVALTIGSIAPDFIYFIPILANRSQSHSFMGLIWYCLPMGLAAFVVFFLFFAPLIIVIAPKSLSSRLPRDWQFGRVPHVPVFSLSIAILVGALTHIIWDSFTHAGGWPIALFPMLNQVIVSVGGYQLYGYKVLQHSSTLMGVALLLYWFLMWYRSTQVFPPINRLRRWQRISLISLLFVPPCMIGAASGLVHVMNSTEIGFVALLRVFIGNAIFSGGQGFLVCTLLGGLTIKYRWQHTLSR